MTGRHELLGARQRGDHVLLAPPFIVTDADLDAIVERLGSAVEMVLKEAA